MRNIRFIIPEVNSFISGGNLYNQQLIKAIELVLGEALPCITIHQLTEKRDLLEKGYFFIDSLYLDQFSHQLASKKTDQSFYLIVHHLASMYPQKEDQLNDKETLLELQQLKLYDGFLITSNYTRTYLRSKGLSQPILELPPVPNRATVLSSKRPPFPIKAIIVANLIPRKGILPFLTALGLLATEEEINGSIDIIGETSLDEKYALQCKKEINSNPFLRKLVTLKGPLPQEEVQRAFRSANLFISVSAFETFGMALQEAAIYGLPILAIKGGNIENHVEIGVNGYLFDHLEELLSTLLSLVKVPSKMTSLLLDSYSLSKRLSVGTWEERARLLIASIDLD